MPSPKLPLLDPRPPPNCPSWDPPPPQRGLWPPVSLVVVSNRGFVPPPPPRPANRRRLAASPETARWLLTTPLPGPVGNYWCVRRISASCPAVQDMFGATPPIVSLNLYRCRICVGDMLALLQHCGQWLGVPGSATGPHRIPLPALLLVSLLN